jgi:oxygen-dependent protoporphyrinogen oxidase
VLEASDGIGGRTRTFERDGFRIDSGAIFVMGSYERTLAYLAASGHAAEMGRWRARTGVMDERGRITRVRFDHPWTLLRMPQLTWADRARVAARLGLLAAQRGAGPFTLEELAGEHDDETLEAWSRRSLGERPFEYLIRPLMGPLTGADPAQISPAFTIALMHQVTRTQLIVPRDGVGSIARWLLDGIPVRLSTPALSLTHGPNGVTVDTPHGPIDADAVILAVDAVNAARFLQGRIDPAIHAAIAGVTPIRAHHVLLGYQNDPWPHAPVDLVVRAGRGLHHDYGALLNGRRAPGSVPPGAQSVSVYLDAAQTAGLDETQIVAKAVESADQAFGPATPDLHVDFAMDVALIAPTPGHYGRMLAARDRMPARLRLAGDYLTHSGIDGALRSGENAARDILAARHQFADHPLTQRTEPR